MLVCLVLPATALAQYRFDAWTSDNGLPHNFVYSILQTRDGYLWLATLDGLVRYDGVRFTVFNTGNARELPSNRFTDLLEDRTGALWIGTEGDGLDRNLEARSNPVQERALHSFHRSIRSTRTIGHGLRRRF